MTARSTHRNNASEAAAWLRLARLACDLDTLVQELSELPAVEVDALWLAMPGHHLALAFEDLQEQLDRADECLPSLQAGGMTFTADDLAQLRAAEQADRENGVSYTPAPQATTWAPVPLDDVLAGDYEPPRPSMLARSDGHCLLYPAKSHSAQAEPEALKTWLALGACVERLAAGEAVLYIDFEDSAAGIVQRLRALGVNPEVIRARFTYMRPDEPLTAPAIADLDQALALQPSLAIIDGVTEAFSRQGLNPLDNGDVALWLDLLPRRITRAGAAVLQLDHVVKSREDRGRYAIGAQHKLAGVNVAYSLHVVEPFGRGRDGVVTIEVQKDRPGGIREYAQNGHVATLRATSHDDGRVSLALEPPAQHESATTDSTFRPTGYMERISLAVEAEPGLSKRSIRAAVGGTTKWCDLALELLIAEKFVRVERVGSANQHHSRTPYREDRDCVTQTVTDRDSVTPEVTVTRDSPLKGGHGHGTETAPPNSADRDSTADLQPQDGETFEQWEQRLAIEAER